MGTNQAGAGPHLREDPHQRAEQLHRAGEAAVMGSVLARRLPEPFGGIGLRRAGGGQGGHPACSGPAGRALTVQCGGVLPPRPTPVEALIKPSAHTCALGLLPRLPVVRQDQLHPGHCGSRLRVADELVTFQCGCHGNRFAGSRRAVHLRPFEPDHFPPAKQPDIDTRLGTGRKRDEVLDRIAQFQLGVKLKQNPSRTEVPRLAAARQTVGPGTDQLDRQFQIVPAEPALFTNGLFVHCQQRLLPLKSADDSA